MRRGVDYAERAEECRRLAKSCQRPEDWGHLLEMAETWQMLLKHQQERSRWQTIALAERFRNVLFPSDIAAKGAAEENGNEKAA